MSRIRDFVSRWWHIFVESGFVQEDDIRKACLSGDLETVSAPDGDWPGREGHLRLIGPSLSIFYLKTDRPDGVVETLDLLVKGVRGGVWVTFVNDKIVALTLNARKKNLDVLDPSFEKALLQTLGKVRFAAERPA